MLYCANLLVNLSVLLLLYLWYERESIKRCMIGRFLVKSASDKVLGVAFATNVVNAAAVLFNVLDSLFFVNYLRDLLHDEVFVFPL